MEDFERRDQAEAEATAKCVGCVEPLRVLLISLWLLNVMDLLLTRDALARGVAEEANAIMGYFMDLGPGISILFKIGVVTVGVVALWLLRRYRATLYATALVTAFYACVVLYQLVWLSRLAAL